MGSDDIAAALPNPDTLERICRAIAALDVVLIEEPLFRTYGYQPSWMPDGRLATMDNGSGDQYQIVFVGADAVVRGFDHESDLSPWGLPQGQLPDGMLDGYPDHLLALVDEPSFRTEGGPRTDMTFCAWWTSAVAQWSTGGLGNDGGGGWLLDLLLDGSPRGYCGYAADYLELDVAPEAVAPFYEIRSASGDMISSLRPSANAATTRQELAAMGYPTS